MGYHSIERFASFVSAIERLAISQSRLADEAKRANDQTDRQWEYDHRYKGDLGPG